MTVSDKRAISNIALSPLSHVTELQALTNLGFRGLEVAPSRVWRNTWKGLTSNEVRAYRNDVEDAGLRVIGLHSLFFDHPELSIFESEDGFADACAFLIHLSEVCRDLGGCTLIWGGGRKRNTTTYTQAMARTKKLLDRILPLLEEHETCLCFEPLGPKDTDFLNSVSEILPLVQEYDSSGLKIQLDAKALVENDEVSRDVFTAAQPYLVHFHANEPGLGIIGSSGEVPHQTLATLLNEIEYDGFVSIEQRMLNQANAMPAIEESARALEEFYGR